MDDGYSSRRRQTPVDKFVGARVRAARREMGVTQIDLAKMMDRSPQQIAKYETGADRIASGVLFEFSQKLNKPVRWFFEDVEPAASNALPDTDIYQTCLDLLQSLKGSPELAHVYQYLELVRRTDGLMRAHVTPKSSPDPSAS